MTEVTREPSHSVVWGANSHGQLLLFAADAVDFSCPSPTYTIAMCRRAVTCSDGAGFPASATVTMVACGGGHTVLVDNMNAVWFCGSYDELPHDDPPPVFVQAWPAPFQSQPSNVGLVACGFDFSVLVLENGCCFAWGHNDFGQLAVSSSELRFSQHPRRISNLTTVKSVSCGLDSCVAVSAPAGSPIEPASVYEWGGKCGHLPRRVSFPDGATPSTVAAGSRHRACACVDGRLFLWGSGRAVQGVPVLPHPVDGADVRCSPHALVCTWRGTAFLSPEGCVNVIGPNDFMQHGAASTLAHGSIRFASGETCIKLMAGSEHFAALLERADGVLRIVTWGWGEHGQLGSGSATDGGPCCVAEFAADQRVHVAAGAAFVVAVATRVSK